MARAATTTALVLAVSGQNVTVDLGQTSETLLKLRSVSVAAGDLVQIGSSGGARFVVGVIGAGTAPTPEAQLEVPPPDPDAIDTGSWSFTPINPGTYRDGTWIDTALLRQGRYGVGARQGGAAWYGLGPAALPGVLVAAEVELRRVEGPAGVYLAPTMTLLAGGARPDGAPVVLDAAPGPGLQIWPTSTTWTVPADWLPLLGDGTAAGIGCYVDDDDPVLGLTSEGDGMTLTCYWEDQS